MIPSKQCTDFIKSFEGYNDQAYLDAVNVATIGWGTTRYPNGKKVQVGDVCTEEEAFTYLIHDVNETSFVVARLLKETPLNQGQYDAMVSFTYNLGIGALAKSTLLKKVKRDPHDYSIFKYKTDDHGPIVKSCEFLKWVYAGDRILKGLVRRRAAEADMYGGK